MAEAILKDQKRILPCAAFLQGEYGVNGLFVGVLCKLGGNGLEQVIELKLNDEERKGLDNSIKAVQELVDALKKLEF
jgi:malate dehydrogenase